jgi:hypothetical protein
VIWHWHVTGNCNREQSKYQSCFIFGCIYIFVRYIRASVSGSPLSAMSYLCKAILNEFCMRSENSHGGTPPPVLNETLVGRCNNISGFCPDHESREKEKSCHCDDRMPVCPVHSDDFAIPAISARPYAVHYFRNRNRNEERCRKVRFLETTLGSFTTTTTATLGEIASASSEEVTFPFLSLPRTDSLGTLPSIKWAGFSTSRSR